MRKTYDFKVQEEISTQLNSVLLCSYVADPATFLASNSVPGGQGGHSKPRGMGKNWKTGLSLCFVVV